MRLDLSIDDFTAFLSSYPPAAVLLADEMTIGEAPPLRWFKDRGVKSSEDLPDWAYQFQAALLTARGEQTTADLLELVDCVRWLAEYREPMDADKRAALVWRAFRMAADPAYAERSKARIAAAIRDAEREQAARTWAEAAAIIERQAAVSPAAAWTEVAAYLRGIFQSYAANTPT